MFSISTITPNYITNITNQRTKRMIKIQSFQTHHPHIYRLYERYATLEHNLCSPISTPGSHSHQYQSSASANPSPCFLLASYAAFDPAQVFYSKLQFRAMFDKKMRKQRHLHLLGSGTLRIRASLQLDSSWVFFRNPGRRILRLLRGNVSRLGWMVSPQC